MKNILRLVPTNLKLSIATFHIIKRFSPLIDHDENLV